MEREGEDTQGSDVPNDRSKTQPLYVCLPFHNMETTTMSDNNTTVRNRDSLIQMFLDATAGEIYGNGRLAVRDEGEGRVSLIAYGWNKIAEYDSRENHVTLFAGHSNNISQTVTRYVNLVHEMAAKRKTRTITVLADSAPNVARPPAGAAQYIGSYVEFEGSDTSLEQKARRDVDAALERAV